MIELVKRISIFIINPIIQLLLAAATAYFLWGIFRFLSAQKGGEDTNVYKRHLVWGIVGLTVMMGAFGIMRLITKTIDADDYIEITEGGDVQVDEDAFLQ